MKVQPLKLEFNTAREQAEYYFNQQFQSVRSELVKAPEGGYWNILRPSDVVIVEDFFDSRGSGVLETYLKEYNEQEVPMEDLEEGEVTVDNWKESLGFIDYVVNSREYDDYLYGDFADTNYPMWGWVFACDSFWTDSDYMNVDKLHRLGIGVLEDAEGNQYLFISGAGYDFYDAHWIPLFKEVGWIKEIAE